MQKGMTMKIGVFQFRCSGDLDANYAAIERAIKQAATQHVRLLVFAECALCGYPPVETDIQSVDYEGTERSLAKIRLLAKEAGLYVALGLIRMENGRRYNSLELIGPDGNTIGHYDKRALWGWDLDHFDKGGEPGIFHMDGLTVGFRICYEVRFPEYFRELFKAGTDICFVSFSDVSEQDSQLRYDIIKANLMTRAVENAMTVISVNSISKFQTAPTAVFGPEGEVKLETPKNEEFLLVFDYRIPEPTFSMKGRIRHSHELNA